MRRLVIFGLAVSLLACAKPAPKVAGTWTVSFPGANASQILLHETTYGPDGKYMGVAKTKTPNGATMIETETGAWSIEGTDKLTAKVDDIQWSFEGADAANIRHWLDQLEPNEKKRINELNAMSPVTLTWKGDDEFSLTLQGQTIVCRRKTG